KSCSFVVKPRSLGDLVGFEYFQGEVLVVLETLVIKKVGDQDVGDDSVRDVSLNLRESMADRIWRIKGVNPYNEAMKQPRQAARVIRNPILDYGLANDEGDGIGVSAHADKFSLASSFEGFTSSFGELNPKSLIMNPTSGPKIEVAAWSNATPAGVSNDSTTTPTGGANMEAKSKVQHTSANEQQVMSDRSKTHVDLVLSSLNVPCVPGMANVVALFGVPLNTLGDFDNLTKDIKLGKYEVWSNLPSEKRTEVMDTIWAMWDDLLVENPNVTSGYSLYSGNSDPLESTVKSSTNIDDIIHVDEPPIVQFVIVQDMPNSYAGAAGGSKSVPSKSKANFRLLFLENLCEGANFSIPKKVVEMERSIFARCLIEINADDVLKESLMMGVPLIKGSGFTIETVTIEYEWKPPRCDPCKIFGHVHDHFPKMVSIPPTIVTHNAVTPTIEKTNDGFQTVGKKKKKGKPKSTNSSVGPLESDIRRALKYQVSLINFSKPKGAKGPGMIILPRTLMTSKEDFLYSV
ncbi:hypothetical protein Tco_1116796, partial [Tanacetum coccineum]